MNNFKLGNRIVGKDYPPLIIAEIGINHNGSLDKAIFLADKAIEAGAEVIKHQTHIPNEEMSIEAKKITPLNANRSIYELIKKCALSFSNFFQICDDFEDVEQDSKNFNNLNQVLLFGKEKAKKFFYDNIDVFRDCMEKLNLYSDLMEEIVQYLIKKL